MASRQFPEFHVEDFGQFKQTVLPPRLSDSQSSPRSIAQLSLSTGTQEFRGRATTHHILKSTSCPSCISREEKQGRVGSRGCPLKSSFMGSSMQTAKQGKLKKPHIDPDELSDKSLRVSFNHFSDDFYSSKINFIKNS